MVKVLFICSGNICRSPTAEGVFRKLAREAGLEQNLEAQSAGTHGFHRGEAPDPRTAEAAARRGYDLSGMVSRQVRDEDFDYFDYLLAMDETNHRSLAQICPADAEAKLKRFLDFAPEAGTRDVPDPYYGGPNGFDEVIDLAEAGVRGLIAHIKATHF